MIEISHEVNPMETEAKRSVTCHKPLRMGNLCLSQAAAVPEEGIDQALMKELDPTKDVLWSMIWIWGKCPADMFRNTGEN